MDDKERDKKIRALIENVNLPDSKEPDLRLVTFTPALDCDWDECPEGLHRFLILSHPETDQPMISMCVQDENTGEVEQLVMTIDDALLMHDIVGQLLGPLTMLFGLLGPPDDE